VKSKKRLVCKDGRKKKEIAKTKNWSRNCNSRGKKKKKDLPRSGEDLKKKGARFAQSD